jgi:hypothetical protein
MDPFADIDQSANGDYRPIGEIAHDRAHEPEMRLEGRNVYPDLPSDRSGSRIELC